ncbi:ribosomal RNA small subunit methyltransferase A [bacterium]|nr:ribosomal RNA small subunit methyltransferase A [bacterium]
MGHYLGQHFLKNKSVIEHAVQAITPQPNGILEVGPGAMALTNLLIESFTPLILVERDPKLIQPILDKIAPFTHVSLVHRDVLEYDFQSAYEQFQGPFGLISNLPYLISTPFLERLLPISGLFTKVYLMLQKEVVEKVLAPSGPKSTRLSHLLRLFYTVESGPIVPPNAFAPPPKVDSQFLQLTPIAPHISVEELTLFKKFLQQGYNHRNHTLSWFLKKFLIDSPPLSNQKLEDLSTFDWCKIFRYNLKTKVYS